MLPDMLVPSRILRKPWFIILEHFAESLEFYESLGCSDLKTLIDDKDNLIEYEHSSDSALKVVDIIEAEWIKSGILINNKQLPFGYAKLPQIKHGLYVHVCGVISLALKKIINGKDIKDESPLGRKTGRFIQNDINSRLLRKKGKTFQFSDQKIEIEYDNAEGIIKLATLCLTNSGKSKTEKEDELILLEGLHEYLKQEYESTKDVDDPEAKRYQAIREQHDKFWRAKSDLRKIPNSKWLCFQRTDSCNTEGGFGISISPIEIKSNAKKKLTAAMVCKYAPPEGEMETYQYAGLVTLDDSTNNLVVEMKRISNDNSVPESIAYFIMQIGDDKNQTLMMGHFLYFSLVSRRYICKNVIWHLIKKSPIPFIKNVSSDKDISEYAFDLNPVDDRLKFEEIPLIIRRYLSNRSQNRLTLPEKRITHLEKTESSLKNWIDEKYKQAEDEKLNACCGRYKVLFYYGGNIEDQTSDAEIIENIREDELQIEFDTNTVEYKAHYTHTRDQDLKYVGKVGRQNSTVEVVVEHPAESKRKTFNKNVIFLTFAIPTTTQSVFKKEFSKFDTFTGVISGLNDKELTPVSFIALIKKVKTTINGEDIPSFRRNDSSHPASTDVVSFFKDNKNQLSIQTDKFATTITSGELIGILTEKGYGSFGLDDNLIIKDINGKIIHQVKVVGDLDSTVLSIEEFIKSVAPFKDSVVS